MRGGADAEVSQRAEARSDSRLVIWDEVQSSNKSRDGASGSGSGAILVVSRKDPNSIRGICDDGRVVAVARHGIDKRGEGTAVRDSAVRRHASDATQLCNRIMELSRLVKVSFNLLAQIDGRHWLTQEGKWCHPK
jgi:hypothetical protein